jgi:outer membrane protein OmpA-like peptidoglycan-associated protein
MVTTDECGFIVQSLYFDAGSAVLRASQLDALRATAQMFRCLLRTGEVTRWQVIGHADVHERDAQQLSLLRSEAVVKALIAHGVAAGTLEVAGVGDTLLDDVSDTPAGRARNREVTFLMRTRPGQ